MFDVLIIISMNAVYTKPGGNLTEHLEEECSVDPHLKHIPVPCSISLFTSGQSAIKCPDPLQL